MDLSNKTKPKKNSWLVPWIVLTICVLPVIASTALYSFWKPDGFVNSGELIGPVPIYDLEVSTSQGEMFSFAALNGFWSFVSIDTSGCDDICEKKLYLMRQIRLTQGAEKDRLERLHFALGDNSLSKNILDEHEGTQFISLLDASELAVFGNLEDATNYIYLVDQIGNLMMRFPVTIDPSLMKKDVRKLLKISKAWKKIN